MYNKLVFYLESVHSGSMFEGALPEDINIYATTASGPNEFSYGTYSFNDSYVNGTFMDTCLGNEFSTHWMEHIDSLDDLSNVTLEEQFEIVSQLMNKSHIHKYGDKSIGKEALSDYFGKCSVIDYILGLFSEKKSIPLDKGRYMMVNSQDMKLEYLKRRAERTNDIDDYKEYLEEVKMAERTRIIFDIFKKKYNIPEVRESKEIDFDCLRQSTRWYDELCGMDHDRDHKYINYFTTFCTMKLSSWKVYHTFKDLCSKL